MVEGSAPASPYPEAGLCVVRRALEEALGDAYREAEEWERFYEELWLNWWECERVSAKLVIALAEEPPEAIWKTGTVREMADWAETRIAELESQIEEEEDSWHREMLAEEWAREREE